MAEENEGPTTSENEGGFKMNWLALWVTVAGLIVIGWCLGLLVHPPEAELIHCPEEDMIEIIGVEEGVIAICVDYTE